MSAFAFDWLFEHAAAEPMAPAVGTPAAPPNSDDPQQAPGAWISYGELASWTRALASELARDEVGPGAFVVLALPAGPAAVAAALAVQALGGCAVEINPGLDARSLRSILEQTGARHLFIQGRDVTNWVRLLRAEAPSHAGPRGAELPKLHVLFPRQPPPRMEQLLEGLRWSWRPEDAPQPEEPSWEPSQAHRDPDAPALLVFTSGSTGTPRGVIQTHANIRANTEAICGYLGLKREDRALSTLPLFYCYGRSILQTHLFVGGSIFFDHRFMYPRVVMEELGRQRCTGFYGVPLTFESLRRQVDVRELSREHLRYVAQAGGAMRPDTIRWCRDVFSPAKLYIMYGQTEATARLSYLPPELAVEKEGSIGRGLDNLELRVVDPAGEECRPREVGEVVARGPSISPGYWGAPEESAEVFRDGWLWTGDLGWRDEDGFIFLVGRSKEMLKLGGHRVSAAEIEQVLMEDPRVAEAAVVGIPNPTGGEGAVAFVVPAPEQTVAAEEIRRHCRERMPAFKVPQEVRVVGALPRTASGKLARAELRREFLDEP